MYRAVLNFQIAKKFISITSARRAQRFAKLTRKALGSESCHPQSAWSALKSSLCICSPLGPASSRRFVCKAALRMLTDSIWNVQRTSQVKSNLFRLYAKISSVKHAIWFKARPVVRTAPRWASEKILIYDAWCVMCPRINDMINYPLIIDTILINLRINLWFK